MAKSKGKRNDKQKDARSRDAGSSDITRAEERLAGALADFDVAGKKVARRERELAALMERHGRYAPIGSPDAEAIPLAAPSLIAIEDASAHVELEPDAVEPDAVEPAPVEELAEAPDDEQHG